MKNIILLSFCLLSATWSHAQESASNYKNYPIVLSLQFHSISMPFQKIGHHFKNLGIGIGTEISHNDTNQDWAQTLRLVWHRNKTMGDGIQLYTQTVYRPNITDNLFGEVRLGVGYQYMYRPVSSFQFQDGEWENVGKKGKGMWMFPANAGLGSILNDDSLITTSINYQWMILKGFSKSLPIVPQSTIMLNNRIHN